MMPPNVGIKEGIGVETLRGTPEQHNRNQGSRNCEGSTIHQ